MKARRRDSKSLPFSGANGNSSTAGLARRQKARSSLRGLAMTLLALGSLLAITWTFGPPLPALKGIRASHTSLFVSRDLSAPIGERTKHEAAAHPNEMVLILCPMKNAIEHIWHYFHLIDSLTYPRHLIQIAVLVSDSHDGTFKRAKELANERQTKWRRHLRYNKISVLNKNFADSPAMPAAGIENIGKTRHSFELQIHRRTLLAKSRASLLSAGLSPEVDWALWMDVDIVDYKPTLIEDLLSWSRRLKTADVIVPNCMWKTYDDMGPYDKNNWAETDESMAIKASLQPSDILIEGYPELQTGRYLLADAYSRERPETSPDEMELDGVGGCCTFVRAEMHRNGATFPAYAFDNQIETEGFAQMVKRLGGRMVGLPKYHVFHGLYG